MASNSLRATEPRRTKTRALGSAGGGGGRLCVRLAASLPSTMSLSENSTPFGGGRVRARSGGGGGAVTGGGTGGVAMWMRVRDVPDATRRDGWMDGRVEREWAHKGMAFE